MPEPSPTYKERFRADTRRDVRKPEEYPATAEGFADIKARLSAGEAWLETNYGVADEATVLLALEGWHALWLRSVWIHQRVNKVITVTVHRGG